MQPGGKRRASRGWAKVGIQSEPATVAGENRRAGRWEGVVGGGGWSWRVGESRVDLAVRERRRTAEGGCGSTRSGVGLRKSIRRHTTPRAAKERRQREESQKGKMETESGAQWQVHRDESALSTGEIFEAGPEQTLAAALARSSADGVCLPPFALGVPHYGPESRSANRGRLEHQPQDTASGGRRTDHCLRNGGRG